MKEFWTIKELAARGVCRRALRYLIDRHVIGTSGIYVTGEPKSGRPQRTMTHDEAVLAVAAVQAHELLRFSLLLPVVAVLRQELATPRPFPLVGIRIPFDEYASIYFNIRAIRAQLHD